MNTMLILKYADASNYKKFLDVVLEGAITLDQLATLKSKLNDGSDLIAHQVGLPTPSEKFDEDFEFPTADDHVWTELEPFADGIVTVEDLLTESEPTVGMTIDEFIEKIEALEEWDVSAEIDRLGIPDY